MTPEQFCYWLQGFFEISMDLGQRGLTPQQCQVIQDHLQLVFDKVTPNRGGSGGGEKPKVLTEDDIKELIIATRPGVTCSDAPVNPFDPHPLCSHDTRYC